VTHRRIEPLSQRGKGAIQHEAGRVCQSPGCDTRLSIYNSSSRCSVHEGMAEQMQLAPSGRPSRPSHIG
jgi:hypothetical protein